MPRTSRTVAQRLAAQNRTRKRRPARPAGSVPSPAVERILDEVSPDETAPPAPPTIPRAPAARRLGSTVAATKVHAPRRAYADYARDYAYVWGDLQRIAVVAGGLLVLLVVLSLVIR
jgi:hypothetical protein